jgi:hypothetical protein
VPLLPHYPVLRCWLRALRTQIRAVASGAAVLSCWLAGSTRSTRSRYRTICRVTMARCRHTHPCSAARSVVRPDACFDSPANFWNVICIAICVSFMSCSTGAAHAEPKRAFALADGSHVCPAWVHSHPTCCAVSLCTHPRTLPCAVAASLSALPLLAHPSRQRAHYVHRALAPRRPHLCGCPRRAGGRGVRRVGSKASWRVWAARR